MDAVRMLLLLLLLPLYSPAAEHCVRAGASGSGSGVDWTNAYTALPSTLTRGDTYYIADGTYAGYQFNDLESGTTLITIKKATVADHGTSTGWDNAYGDGVATFTGSLFFMTDDWVFDGQVGGGPGSWHSGHGFKVSGSIQINPSWNDVHTWEVGVDNGGDDTAIRHVEIEGTLTPSTDDSISFANNTGVTISHVWTRNGDNCPFNIFVSTNWVVEYSSNSEFASSEEHHAEIFFLYGKGGGEIRYNLFRWAESTGGIMVHNPDEAAVHIHGNVFYRASGETWSYGGDGLVGTWTNRADLECHNLYVVNNTFINIPDNAAGPIGTTPGSVRVWKNNYFYNSDTGLPNAAWTADYNHYQDSGSESESNGTTGTGDPFVDFASYDFRLESNTTAGEDLGSTYGTDMLGNTRTTWTRGAIEFQSEGGGGGGGTYAPTRNAGAALFLTLE